MGAWSEYKKQQEQERRTGKWTEYKQSGSYRKSGAAAAPAANVATTRRGDSSDPLRRSAPPPLGHQGEAGSDSLTQERYKAQGGVTFEQYKAAVDSITQQRYRAMRGMTEEQYRQRLDANARQLRNENTSPHQSAAPTASPRGEATGAAGQSGARGGFGKAEGEQAVKRNQELSGKVSEQEFNRSTAMQQKYGSYQNYLRGVYAGYDEAMENAHRAKQEQAQREGKVTEQEFNRSTAMQKKYGTYQNYLNGVTTTTDKQTRYQAQNARLDNLGIREDVARYFELDADEDREEKDALRQRFDEMGVTGKDLSDFRALLKNPKLTGDYVGFGEAAADAFISGSSASWLGGQEATHAVAEAGINKAAAWALRDLAKSKVLGGIFGQAYRDSLNALADKLATDIDWSGAQAWQDEYSRIMERATKDRTDVGKFVVENLPSVGSMLLDAGLAGMSGVNPIKETTNLSTLTSMASRAGGNAAVDAKNAGATDGEAILIGLENAAVEVFSEKLFGGNPVYDEDVGLINRAAAKLKNKTLLRVLDSKAFGLVSEGLEEVVAELLEPTFQSLVLDGTLEGSVTAEDLGLSFLGGVFVGVLGDAAGMVSGLSQERQDRYMKQYAKILIRETDGSTNADVQAARDTISDKLAYGRAPDMQDFGRLIDALDKAGESDAAERTVEEVQREASESDVPENMDVEDDIPSNMDVIDEDGDGLPDNMELEADERQVGNNEPSPHQSASRTASPRGEAMGASETANGEPEVRTVLRQAGQEDVRGRVKGDKLFGKVGDTLREYKARLKEYDARTAELRGLEANAQQVRNNEPSPHQSPTATASPRGEAINARVQELREQIAQDEAYLEAKERDMQDVANVARARLENERQQKEMDRETQTLSDKELRETEQSAQAQESAAELAARRAAEEQDAAELERIAKQREYSFAMTQYFISGYFDANDRVQMDIPTYAEAVRVAYGKGRFGWKFKREDLQRGIADEVLQEAYKEGRRKGEENGTAGIGNGGERDAGMDSDEPSGRVGRGAGGAEKESAGGFGVKESLRIQSVLGTAKAEWLSPKADGIENGSDQKMFYRVPDAMVQEYPALKQAKQILTDAGADDVRLVSGSIRIRTAGGREMSVQGVAQGTTVWLTIDAKDGVLKTAEHEAMHLRLEAEPGLRERLIDALGLSQEQRDKLARKYCEAYDGCYTGEDLSAYLDEIVCDAYAGINRMGLGADKLQSSVRAAADSTTSQRTKKPEQTRGPPVKLSKDTSTREQTQREITERYQNEVHEILENGKRSTGALVVGYTPELYRKLGMPELPFVIGGGHVYSIAKTRAEAEAEGRAYKNVNYHGLGENTVANILELVKKPVMVIASKDVNKTTTPMRSTHSVVALVDVGKNGKSLIIPVSITAESTVDGTVMDVNMLTSAYEKNARGLANEAIAQLNAGENSVFYVQKEAATLLGEGVQFPSILEAAAASNGIVRRFDEKINMSVKNVTQSQQFKRWFGDWQNQPEKASKVVNADGTPKVVYHQTDGEFTVFDTRKQGAGTRDSETPFGIFMKSSDRDIGLRGKKQMALYANIRNPLIAQNRADLKQQLRTMSADYAALTQQHEELDQEYRKKFQNANENFKTYILDWRKQHPGADSRELYGTAEFERLFNEEDRVSEEWTEKADELSLREKNALTDALRRARYDGVHLLNDAGSFGRSTDAWIALNPNQVKSAADNVGTFGKNNPDIRFSPETRERAPELTDADAPSQSPAATALPEGEPRAYDYDKLPGKARAFVDQAVNSAVRRAGRAMSVPYNEQQRIVKPALQELMKEFLKTGKIAQNAIDRAFDKAYDEGIEVNYEFFHDFKHIRDKLLKTGVRVTPEVRAEFADLEQFRRAVRGKILLNNEGIGIDTLYGELHDEAPGLFPEAIMNPADQLMRMIEVADKIQITKQTLDEAHKGDGGDYKRWAKNDFEAAVEDMKASLRTARAWAESRERTKLAQEAPKSQAEVEELYKRQREARRAYERVQSKNLLTDEDERILDRLLRGELAPEDIQDRQNAKSILNVYEAKADYAALTAQIARWRRGVKEGYREQVRPLLTNSEQAKDKKGLAPGFRYDRETAERNIEDVFPAADAKRINETIFEPVHTQQAKSTRFKNDYRARVRKMNLSRKVKAGDVVSEAHAVQLYGEAMDNIRQLTKRPMDAKRDGKTLAEWEAVVRELWEKNPGIRKEKVERAVGEFRRIYDELFTQMNDVRVRNGYEPIDYRKGYFPHFRPGQTDGVLAVMGKALGIKADVTALPTTINGLTHTFKPGITWFGNAQERLGFNTAYDAVEGFDKYIEGAADIVFQTDNIQRLRAFASEVRYRTSNEGVRERVDAIRADDSISEQDKELRIKDLYENAKFELSGFAAWLDEYTNLLANKKSKLDRGVESVLGRGFYNAMNWLESRAAANMVAMNPGSWLTNFIPLTQAWGYVSTGDMVQAMGQTIAAMKNDDGFWERSAFLTNRRGSDPLVRTWQGNLSAKLSMPMEWIDTFTADTIVRARYNQNLRRGMLEEDAMREADRFAANIMADRSKGATPTRFQSRNPLVKLFTQFQLEVNNQFSNIFKDLPREMRKRGLQALAWALFKMFFSAWAYNELYEKVVGRRAALDPIDMTNELVGDATGYQLNNVLDVAFGSEAGFIHEGKPAGFGNTVTNFLTSTAEELPMVGGVLGGGRVPFSSALPDVSAIWKVATNKELDSETKNAKLWEEVRDPLLYLGLPFGGGQIRKVAQGIYAVAKGGKFYRNNKGELQMQYPVFTDEGAMTVLRDVQAGVFGRNATKEARDWVESGFSKLSTKETNAYLAMSAADVKQREAWKLIQAMKDVDVPEGVSKKAAKLEALRDYDISDEAKALYYYNVIASDTERAQLDAYMDLDEELADEKVQSAINNAEATAISEEEQAAKEARAERDRASKANYAQMYRKIRDLKLDGYEPIYKSQLKALKEQEGLSDSDARKEIQKGVIAEVKEAFQSGSIDEKMATRILSKNLNESEDDTYWMLEEWKGGPDYSKYGKLTDAMEQNTDAKETVQYYLSHGVQKRDISSQITRYFKPLYKAAETRQEKNEIARQANVFYRAAGYMEKWNDMMKWDKEDS